MNLIKFEPGTPTWQKVVTYFFALLGAVLIAVLYLSVWGILHNDLSVAATKTTAGMHNIGLILLVAAVALVYFKVKEPRWFRLSGAGTAALLGLLLVFSILFYCGFFTGTY